MKLIEIPSALTPAQAKIVEAITRGATIMPATAAAERAWAASPSLDLLACPCNAGHRTAKCWTPRRHRRHFRRHLSPTTRI